MLYPIMFEPIYKEMLWGGAKLKTLYNRQIPSDSVGESWDISCRPKEMGLVANGSCKGMSFSEYVSKDPKGVLGNNLYKDENFPLLIKLIDANSPLSVQVHPGDEYARKMENDFFGKTEMWAIMDAPIGAKLIIGLRDNVTRDEFEKAISDGKAEECLNYLPVSKGDVINIPNGLVHAITEGILIAEVQQNSDITYRIYDYNRKDLQGNFRELHVNKSLDVIDFQNKLKKQAITGLKVKEGQNTLTYYISNDYFTIVKYDISSEINLCSDKDKFHVFTVMEGKCLVTINGYDLDATTGDSIFIPAAMGNYKITGCCSLLKSFVGDTEGDFTKPLELAGYTKEEILSLS